MWVHENSNSVNREPRGTFKRAIYVTVLHRRRNGHKKLVRLEIKVKQKRVQKRLENLSLRVHRTPTKLRLRSLHVDCKMYNKKVLTGRENAETYLSIHSKSLERVVDQASHGLICETASFRATSEHVRHC